MDNHSSTRHQSDDITTEHQDENVKLPDAGKNTKTSGASYTTCQPAKSIDCIRGTRLRKEPINIYICLYTQKKSVFALHYYFPLLLGFFCTKLSIEDEAGDDAVSGVFLFEPDDEEDEEEAPFAWR
jgi:hypothetical protein